MLTLSSFLTMYCNRAKPATERALSLPDLAKMLNVDYFRLAKWAQGKAKPKEESDRLSLKTFFGIEDFDAIKEEVLSMAVKRYPNGLGTIEDLASQKAETKKLIDKDNTNKKLVDLQSITNHQLKNSEAQQNESGGSESVVNSISQNENTPPTMENNLLILAIKSADNEAHLMNIIDRLIEKLPASGLAATGLNRKEIKQHPVKEK